MTEVLYCPKSNKLFLFSGNFRLDLEAKTVTLFLSGKGTKKIEATELVHIGWL
jgi:hypothetical protein